MITINRFMHKGQFNLFTLFDISVGRFSVDARWMGLGYLTAFKLNRRSVFKYGKSETFGYYYLSIVGKLAFRAHWRKA